MVSRDYLERRAAQEEELASIATSETAAEIHAAMAQEYRRRLRKMGLQTACQALEVQHPGSIGYSPSN